MRAALPRLWLAPMAGYTDVAMRRLCHRMGATGAVSEMISAKAVVYRDKKTVGLGHLTPDEGAVLLQIFGREPEVMAEAAAMLAEGYCGSIPYGIDVNMGCPVPKIAGNGEGSALTRDPALCERIVAAIRRALPSGMPLTAKLRLGWDEAHITIRETVAAVVGGGVDAVFIHGRTRAAMYSGEADWAPIAEAAAACPVPVVGNGDITSAEAASARLAECKCYGLMVGRGAVGNPFLFREIAAVLAGDAPPPPPSAEERIRVALAHLADAIADKGEAVAVREARKQIAAYVHGMPGAAAVRAAVNAATTYAEVERILTALM